MKNPRKKMNQVGKRRNQKIRILIKRNQKIRILIKKMKQQKGMFWNHNLRWNQYNHNLILMIKKMKQQKAMMIQKIRLLIKSM